MIRNQRQKEQADIMRQLLDFYKEPAKKLVKWMLEEKLATKSEIARVLDVHISAIDNFYLKQNEK